MIILTFAAPCVKLLLKGGEDMIVSIDREHCRVMVLSRRLPVGMIREGGKWRKGEYSADDIQDFFERASGSEAEMWFQEALLSYRTNPIWAKKIISRA